MTARILIVDDMPANARLLEAQLAAEYYQLMTAQDGFEAIKLALSWQPDLILLDVMMPRMDGFETCRRLKDQATTLHIPVVMVTALGEPEERVCGLEAGADDFLTKPVELDSLLARVRSLVRLKRLLDEWRARGETARALGLAGERLAVPSVSGARALVIDDWDLGARTLAEALAREGIIAGRARSVAEASALTAATPFDLIVLSLSLTSDDPLKIASQLRACDATHEVPMLLVAEAGDRAQLLRGLDLGANDWLMRLIDTNELIARARNQIRRKFYQDRLRADLSHALAMALTDPLTGLYNQRYFMRHLSGLLDAQPPAALAVLMIDVDHFKRVNDEHGHAVGDRVLCGIADTLRGNTRMFDSLARYGGEEFAVVLPGTNEADALGTAERLRQAIEAGPPIIENGSLPTLTISVGIACTDGKGTTAEALMRASDQALYQAKRNGRNRIELSR